LLTRKIFPALFPVGLRKSGACRGRKVFSTSPWRLPGRLFSLFFFFTGGYAERIPEARVGVSSSYASWTSFSFPSATGRLVVAGRGVILTLPLLIQPGLKAFTFLVSPPTAISVSSPDPGGGRGGFESFLSPSTPSIEEFASLHPDGPLLSAVHMAAVRQRATSLQALLLRLPRFLATF